MIIGLRFLLQVHEAFRAFSVSCTLSCDGGKRKTLI